MAPVKELARGKVMQATRQADRVRDAPVKDRAADVVAGVAVQEPDMVRGMDVVVLNLRDCAAEVCVMPGFNGTGPIGRGAMTGRGRGYCISNILPGTGLARWSGRGARRGRWDSEFAAGMLAGLSGYLAHTWLTRYNATAASGADELSQLKKEVDYLEDVVAQAKNRIEELESLKNKE
ncbi:MAG: DUF5320 domain-containing protein [Desulfotomaculaceae bacterium]|nr:DUF5320 domain-containing protein [Desulfotomaculaceae bacterium]